MASNQPSALHKILFEARTARGLSVREAARRIGVSHSRLLDFEQGFDQHTRRPCTPSLATLLSIAKVYELDPLDLMRLVGHDVPGMSLSEEERALIERFRLLSEEKRAALDGFLDELQRG